MTKYSSLISEPFLGQTLSSPSLLMKNPDSLHDRSQLLNAQTFLEDISLTKRERETEGDDGHRRKQNDDADGDLRCSQLCH